MKNIWFIRHGQSESNAGVRTSHPADIGITEKGELQARHIADYIDISPDLIIHSPYKRSLQTALPTIDKFPNASVEQWPIQEFSYLAAEKYLNTTRYDRQHLVTRYWQACDASAKDSGEGESYLEFIQRVEQTYLKLRNLKQRVMVFTHGHYMRAIIWMFLLGYDNDYSSMKKYRNLRAALAVPNGAILKTRLHNESVMTSLITDFIPESIRT